MKRNIAFIFLTGTSGGSAPRPMEFSRHCADRHRPCCGTTGGFSRRHDQHRYTTSLSLGRLLSSRDVFRFAMCCQDNSSPSVCKLSLFPCLLPFPFVFRLDFRRPSCHHVTWRDIANGTVQPHIVVVVDQPVYHPLRVFEARQLPSDQQFVLQRVVELLQLPVRLRVVWRCVAVDEAVQPASAHRFSSPSPFGLLQGFVKDKGKTSDDLPAPLPEDNGGDFQILANR